MAKTKAVTEKTEIEAKIDKIVNAKPKNERIAFARKHKKIQELVESLAPIEEKIMDIIINEKTPIMDEIALMRITMVKECVHPRDELVAVELEVGESYIECKFCNARLVVK